MHSASVVHDMPKNKTKQSNEEQAVSDTLKLLQEAQDNAAILEKNFDAYKQEVHSWTSTSNIVKGCEPDQRSSTGWISWFFSKGSHQKTEDKELKNDSEQQKQAAKYHKDMNNDQNVLNELEIKIQSSLQSNTKWIESFQKDHQNLLQRITDLEKQNQDFRKEISGLKERSRENKSSMEKKQSSSWMSLNYWLPSKHETVTCQLYCQQEAELVPSIMTELKKQLISRCSKGRIELEIEILKSAKNRNPDLPLMVICLHASRLGPDICDATREVKSGPKVAVLVVHNKDIFALPKERSDKILLEEEYREIGAIIDVAFTAVKGMYKCDINKHAIDELATFIKNCADNIKP